MRALISIAVLGLLAVPVMAAELPEWAYPVAPPAGPPPDNTVQKSLPGSTKKYTAAQINDRFGPPDWYPEDHPPMPDIVAQGQKPNAFACDLCNINNGRGPPKTAGESGLPLLHPAPDGRIQGRHPQRHARSRDGPDRIGADRRGDQGSG
jgi:hypothetical protein